MIWVKLFLTALVVGFVGKALVSVSEADDVDSTVMLLVGVVMLFFAVIAGVVSAVAGIWSL